MAKRKRKGGIPSVKTDDQEQGQADPRKKRGDVSPIHGRLSEDSSTPSCSDQALLRNEGMNLDKQARR